MLDVAHIEIKAGGASGFALTSDDSYTFWSGPTAGVASEIRYDPATPKSRFGVALWYQRNTYEHTSSDLDLWYRSHPHPSAHVPQLVLYWGHAFTTKGGSDHGPRVGLGGLVAFAANEEARIDAPRRIYPGVYAEGSYHGALALPATQLSLAAEVAWMIGMNVVGGTIEPTIQFRATVGALWRFDS